MDNQNKRSGVIEAVQHTDVTGKFVGLTVLHSAGSSHLIRKSKKIICILKQSRHFRNAPQEQYNISELNLNGQTGSKQKHVIKRLDVNGPFHLRQQNNAESRTCE